MKSIICFVFLIVSCTINAQLISYSQLEIKQPDSLGVHLDTFYKKGIDAVGIPIVSSSKVKDEALFIARDIVSYMLAGRSDVRQQLVSTHARVMVMAQTEMETDLPERSDWKKPSYDDPRLTPSERENYNKPGGIASLTDKAYWNARARGMGGNETSCAEENLLAIPYTKYYGENILVHEFSHNIMNALETCDKDLVKEIYAAYADAKKKDMYHGQYAINTVAEYWAEGTQWWFWSNFGFKDKNVVIVTPMDLEKYDNTLFNILAKVYIGHHIPADVYYGWSIIK
ncbi:hypothetical protein [Rhizosphaericola mali]|nr:hypothetical protein [Rhizosphaericola mali]